MLYEIFDDGKFLGFDLNPCSLSPESSLKH